MTHLDARYYGNIKPMIFHGKEVIFQKLGCKEANNSMAEGTHIE